MSADVTGPIGAKKRDYFWTVMVVDPVALPLVRLLARKRWLSPNATTWISFALGLTVGPSYAFGERTGLVLGAIVFYLSFVFDCVDGKLARALQVTSDKGKLLDEVADGARRASASLGLVGYLWTKHHALSHETFLAIVFVILAFYFMQISGRERSEPGFDRGGRWTHMLARRRLLPNPGMPDVSGIVFVIGPLTGWVAPAVYVGIGLVSIGILRVWWKLTR